MELLYLIVPCIVHRANYAIQVGYYVSFLYRNSCLTIEKTLNIIFLLAIRQEDRLMETLLVYGLVVVFFVLLIPVIYFLMKDPIAHTDDEPAEAQKTRTPIKIQMEKTASYGILAAIFALMCVLTVLGHRTKT